MSINIDKNTLWFEYPDVKITITNEDIQTKIRKMPMEALLGIRNYIVYDPVLSSYLKAEVCYITRTKQKDLIVSINKKCNMNIDLNINVLVVDINGTMFIIASGTRNLSRKQDNSNVYLRNNFWLVQGDFYYKHGINLFCTMDDLSLRNDKIYKIGYDN